MDLYRDDVSVDKDLTGGVATYPGTGTKAGLSEDIISVFRII